MLLLLLCCHGSPSTVYAAFTKDGTRARSLAVGRIRTKEGPARDYSEQRERADGGSQVLRLKAG